MGLALASRSRSAPVTGAIREVPRAPPNGTKSGTADQAGSRRPTRVRAPYMVGDGQRRLVIIGLRPEAETLSGLWDPPVLGVAESM